MTIEFDCGTVKQNVGMPSLALKAHAKECTDPKCVEDCKKELAKLGDYYSESNKGGQK